MSKRNPRQKKKARRKERSCPECGCGTGIVGEFINNNKLMHKIFLYCNECKYDYSLKTVDNSAK